MGPQPRADEAAQAAAAACRSAASSTKDRSTLVCNSNSLRLRAASYSCFRLPGHHIQFMNSKGGMRNRDSLKIKPRSLDIDLHCVSRFAIHHQHNVYIAAPYQATRNDKVHLIETD